MSGNGRVAALDGDAGVLGNRCPEALKASEIPPMAAIDNKIGGTENLRAFIAPLFT